MLKIFVNTNAKNLGSYQFIDSIFFGCNGDIAYDKSGPPVQKMNFH